ncbi:urea transporter 2-like [Thrips palmi]|uniref:Urea transporter 2-like n=1 Tax=Thrips palmi TaxID=161013 RepID=A0A6P8YPB9_THRPL|nr:urea transporter 2-like [Thrips palmi]
MAVDDNSGPEGAGLTLVGASAAMLVAVTLLGQQDGLTGLTFNGALIGVTLGGGSALHGRPWLLSVVVALSAISAWLSRSLAAAFSRVDLPALNVAFNVLVALWTAVEASWIPPDREPPPAFPANASSVDWGLVATSVLMAPGPVYACSSVSSCCILYVAFLIFSPMLFLVSILGAAVGTLLGVALCPGTDLADLYAGLWGYCPLLTASALGSIFYVFNTQSVVLGLVGAATASLAYGALSRSFQPMGLPVLAWPFVLATWMLVANPKNSLNLTPVPLSELGTPEEVRARALQRRSTLELQAMQTLQPLQAAPRLHTPVPLSRQGVPGVPGVPVSDPIFRH